MTAPEPSCTPNGSLTPYWLRLLLITIILGVLAIVLLFPFPVSGRLWSELFNLAHVPSFLLAFLLVAGLCDPSCIGFPKSWHIILPFGAGRLSVLVIALLVLGVACEVLQDFVGRSSSVSDVISNACGVVAGMFWCLGCQCRTSACRRYLSLIAVGVLIAASWSPIFELYDCSLQHRDFPLLASFERRREMHVWSSHESAIRRTTTWSAHGTSALSVRGTAGTEYPGAQLLWPINNWEGFTALEMDVFNPGETSLMLSISIADGLHAASGNATTDRFCTTVELPSGQHVQVRIELADVRNAPASRLMDMLRIESLNLFIVRPKSDVEFLVDNLRLVED